MHAASRLTDPHLPTLAQTLHLATHCPANDEDIIAITDALIAEGLHDKAIVLLEDEIAHTGTPALRDALWQARCGAAGCSAAVSDYWLDPSPASALVRSLFEAGRARTTLDALAQLLLAGRLAETLADDLAVIAGVLVARGEPDLLRRGPIAAALCARPEVANAAAIILDDVVLPFLDDPLARRAAALLSR